MKILGFLIGWAIIIGAGFVALVIGGFILFYLYWIFINPEGRLLKYIHKHGYREYANLGGRAYRNGKWVNLPKIKLFYPWTVNPEYFFDKEVLIKVDFDKGCFIEDDLAFNTLPELLTYKHLKKQGRLKEISDIGS